MSYPEHEKLHKVQVESQAIGGFIDEFLPSKQIYLCKRHEHTDDCYDGRMRICGVSEGQLLLVTVNIQDLLAEHFGIDRSKLEKEKRDMLAAIRQETRRQAKILHRIQALITARGLVPNHSNLLDTLDKLIEETDARSAMGGAVQ